MHIYNIQNLRVSLFCCLVSIYVHKYIFFTKASVINILLCGLRQKLSRKFEEIKTLQSQKSLKLYTDKKESLQNKIHTDLKGKLQRLRYNTFKLHYKKNIHYLQNFTMQINWMS